MYKHFNLVYTRSIALKKRVVVVRTVYTLSYDAHI